MIVNCGIVDMQIAVGGQENHPGWIDCTPGEQCPQFSGAACFQLSGVVLFQAVDSISGGLGRIFMARNQIKKVTCEAGHIDLA
jgi:hypothetical protein